jgi:hypothetical protein
MFYKNIFILFVFINFALLSCKKEDNYVPEKYAEESILYPEGIENRDATLLAIRDYVGVDLTGTIEIPADFCLAEFLDTEFKNVGQVKLNNDVLSQTSANIYISSLDDINFNLNPGNQNLWLIEGGNGFSAFNRKMEVKMPAKITFDALPNIITLGNNVTLKVKNFPTNAQAIIWQLKDIDGNFIQKETLTNELTLTSAELSQLIPGRNSLIKVAAYSLDKWDNGGKRFVFINEMVETANLELK